MAREKRDHQAHVFMTRELYKHVEAKAKAEFRSVNSQLLYYVTKGIEAEWRCAADADRAGKD